MVQEYTTRFLVPRRQLLIYAKCSPLLMHAHVELRMSLNGG